MICIKYTYIRKGKTLWGLSFFVYTNSNMYQHSPPCYIFQFFFVCYAYLAYFCNELQEKESRKADEQRIY